MNLLCDLPRVSSGAAAAIVGVGFEGFRTYLKRGLLGRVGMLPGFHRFGSEGDDPRPRSKWWLFGFADLCLMRTAKLLMDAGFSFDSANAVVSQSKLWSSMAHDTEPTERYLLVWPPYADHILFQRGDFVHLGDRVIEASRHGVCTLLNLEEVQRHVAAGLTAKGVTNQDDRELS